MKNKQHRQPKFEGSGPSPKGFTLDRSPAGRTSPGASDEKAFTRVDLLAVTAALGLLAFTLLPALARSQSPAQRSVCVDNLRQLAQAVLMYAADNRDALPYPNWGNSTLGWLYTPVAGAPPNLSAQPYATNALLAYQKGALWPFVKTTNIYRCPLDLNSLYYPMRANKLSTYVMNGAVCGYGTRVTTYALSRFAPSAYCLWEPDELLGNPPIGAFAYNDASSYPDRSEGAGRRHPGGTPVGTFGGNVEWVSFKAFANAQISVGPNNVWCNPGTANGH